MCLDQVVKYLVIFDCIEIFLRSSAAYPNIVSQQVENSGEVITASPGTLNVGPDLLSTNQ